MLTLEGREEQAEVDTGAVRAEGTCMSGAEERKEANGEKVKGRKQKLNFRGP